MPVDRGRLGELVRHVDADAVALLSFDGGTGGLSVVAPAVDDQPWGEFTLHWFGDEMKGLEAFFHRPRQGHTVRGYNPARTTTC